MQRFGAAVELDGEEVASAVLAELELEAVACRGTVASRLAALASRAGDPALWLRLAGATDLVGRYGCVGVIDGLRNPRVSPARGSYARSVRGPPR